MVGKKPELILTGHFVYVFLDKNRISQHKTQPLLHLTHIVQWGISPTDTFLVTDASEMLHTSSSMDGVTWKTGHKKQTPRCKGLSLSYLAARSDVKNVWDIRRNKKNISVDKCYYSFSRLI